MRPGTRYAETKVLAAKAKRPGRVLHCIAPEYPGAYVPFAIRLCLPDHGSAPRPISRKATFGHG